MATLPSLKQLHYLVVLSEQLNFTRAADACFVTQSTLSAGLKELEQALGVQLVERNRQKVMMTDIGQEVVVRARAILSAAHDLSEFAARAAEPMTGTLRLGIIPTIAPFVLPQWLPLLRERYPKLRLALREDLTANLVQRINDGDLDFALIALPYETGDLRVKVLFDDSIWVVGRRNDPEVQGRTVDPERLSNDRLLLLEEGHCLREHALQACGKTLGKSDLSLEATSLLTMVQMVESGLGIGLVPEMAVKSGLTDSPALLAKPVAEPSPKRVIALVTRSTTAHGAEFELLSELFRQCEPAATKNGAPGRTGSRSRLAGAPV